MPWLRNFSHLVKGGVMADRMTGCAAAPACGNYLFELMRPLMVRSALIARVSNHEARYAAILRDARLWRAPDRMRKR